MTGAAPTDIIEEFVHFRLLAAEENHGLGTPDIQLFRDLTSGTASHLNHIDPLISSTLSKEGSLDKLETTLQAILRVGVFELIIDSSICVETITGFPFILASLIIFFCHPGTS